MRVLLCLFRLSFINSKLLEIFQNIFIEINFKACAAIEGQYFKQNGKLIKLSGLFFFEVTSNKEVVVYAIFIILHRTKFG